MSLPADAVERRESAASGRGAGPARLGAREALLAARARRPWPTSRSTSPRASCSRSSVRPGCGKTTLLRLLCGLTPPTEGTVLLDGRPVVGPPREVAIVFQDYSRSLFPWLTVIRNVMFPLRRVELSKAEKIDASRGGPTGDGPRRDREQVSVAALGRHAAARRDRTRARLPARSCCCSTSRSRRSTRSPGPSSRTSCCGSTASREGRAATVVHVTHDIDEAVYLADRVLVLSPVPGRIVGSVDVGLPRPRSQTATRSSARFLDRRATRSTT